MSPIGNDPVSRGISVLLMQAAVDLMPSWAQRLHGIRRPPGFDALTVRPTAFAFIATLEAVGGTPIARAQAEARAAATPAATHSAVG
jgi:hypothetical protein